MLLIRHSRDRNGFTLLEMVIAIGIIGIITSVFMVAVNPRKNLEDARNARRKVYIQEQQNGAIAHSLDTNEIPAGIPEGKENAKQVCRPGINISTCINFDAMIPVQMDEIPVDEAETDSNVTGYRVYLFALTPFFCSDYLPLDDDGRCPASTYIPPEEEESSSGSQASSAASSVASSTASLAGSSAGSSDNSAAPGFMDLALTFVSNNYSCTQQEVSNNTVCEYTVGINVANNSALATYPPWPNIQLTLPFGDVDSGYPTSCGAGGPTTFPCSLTTATPPDPGGSETFNFTVKHVLDVGSFPTGPQTITASFDGFSDDNSGNDSDGTSFQVAEVCGDGFQTGAESCDEGGDNISCDNDCTLPACGDGYVNSAAGETCDVYNGGFPGWYPTCDYDCTAVFCGDGSTNSAAGEQCDNGTGMDDTGCNYNCTVNACGDGYVNSVAGEQCDDSNTNSGDGCSSLCTIE